ncbi:MULTISPECIES: AAA family ATPase [unclassified Oceanobacter]|uniref:AAA family ATPase n=1 Tax=unclassified Oceanobacter TaxID=2620260 RepID=UPI0027360981|nr:MULTISPECIES: ATP-binding protein [unclassified Oceanobacter]MDP2607979.1 ATP-binding protein [Oceanobacter sp. 1_MG-2023]MDP2611359.1 ATP-binding protein [Oceanobacter sp. 2_MG-2023]
MSNIAGINNVALTNQAMMHLQDRSPSLPGLGVLHGPSGYGKSFAASYAANAHRAFYIQCKSTWTRKKFLEAILKEMGIMPAKNLADMNEQACEELMQSGRPLIIDEADWLADSKSHVMLAMDLYEGSQASILLIGEERLPAKLAHYEKIHNRILSWVAAEPCQIRDVLQLADIYARDINIAEDLLLKVLDDTHGVTRRICVNLENIRNWAADNGVERVTLENYRQAIFTGKAPRGRS